MAETQDMSEAPRTFGGDAPRYPAEQLERFGPFVELRRIGEGGGGVVYTATNPRLPRTEAVKVLPRGVSESQRARFVQEVRNMALFEIEGVARIYDAGEVDGWLYYSMERIDGVELDRHIAEQALSLTDVLRLLVEVARVLSRLHLRGFVHRDVKPSNIMVTRDGGVRLLDFGIAIPTVSAGASTSATTQMDRAIQGTPDYMAPEQATGEESLGPAADVYAYATMAYRLLCGRHPLGETKKFMVRMTALMTRDPDLLSSHLPDVEPLLDRCLDAAMSKEPDRRPTIDALADDLERVITGAPAVSVLLMVADDCRETTVTLIRLLNGLKAHFRRSALVQVRLARAGDTTVADLSAEHRPDLLILVTAGTWSEQQSRFLARLAELEPRAMADLHVVLCQPPDADLAVPALAPERLHTVRWRQVAELEVGLRDQVEEQVCERVPAARSSQAVTWEGCPYQGLSVFQPEDAPIFFGREAELRQVLSQFRAAQARGLPILLVMGPSGSGKSSFLRAGVLPHIDTVADTERRIQAIMLTIGRAPSIWHAMAMQLGDRQRPDDDPALFTAEGLAERTNWPAVRQLLARDRGVQPVLVMDQLEELFSPQHAADAAGFLCFTDALADGGTLWVLGAIRNDFYPRLTEALGELRPRVTTYDLGLPGAAAMADIIRQPAWVAGLQFGEDLESGRGVDDLLLEEATRTPECLPLLEFTLAALYELRDRDHRRLTAAAYRQIGGVAGALRQRAEDTLRSLPAAEAAEFGAVFQQLVSCQEDGRAVRAYASWQSLTATPERRGFCRAFLEARLLVLNGDQTTVIHESLIPSWPTLSDWVASNREWLVTQRRVAEQHARWLASGRSQGLLLQDGPALSQAEAMHSGLGEQLAPELARYVTESAANAHSARRLKQLAMVALAMLTVVALLLLAVARDQNAKRLVAQGETTKQLAERYLQEGLLAAHERYRPDEAVELFDRARAGRDPATTGGDDLYGDIALARHFWAGQVLMPTSIADLSEAVEAAWIAPDGGRVVVASRAEPGRFVVADLGTGERRSWRLSESSGAAARDLRFVAAERLLITHADGEATLCDATDGRVLYRGRGVLRSTTTDGWLYCWRGDSLQQISVADGTAGPGLALGGDAVDVQVTADGRTALVVRADGTADVYDLASPEQPRTVLDPNCRMMTLGADRMVLAFDHTPDAADAFWWAHPAGSRNLGGDARLVVMDPAIAGPIRETGGLFQPRRWQLTADAVVVLGAIVSPDPKRPDTMVDEQLVVVQRYNLNDGRRLAMVLASIDDPTTALDRDATTQSPVLLSPDGRALLITPTGRQARLWSLAESVRYGESGHLPGASGGLPWAVVDLPVEVSRVAFAATTGRVATLSVDGTCRIWEPDFQGLVGTTTFTREPAAMHLLDEGTGSPRLLTVMADGAVAAWTVSHPGHHVSLKTPAPIARLLPTADGFLAVYADATCQRWTIGPDAPADGTQPVSLPGRLLDYPRDESPWLLCYDAELQLLLVDSRDGSSRVIWDGRARRLAGPPRFTADAQAVVLPLADQPLAVYHNADRTLTETADWAGYRLLATDRAARSAVIADRTATGPMADGQFAVLNLADGSTRLAATPYLVSPVLSDAGDRLAWGTVDGLYSLDPQADTPPEHRPWQLDPPSRLQYSADGRWLLSAHPAARRLRLRDAATLDIVADLPAAADSRVVIDDGSDRLAVIDDRGQVRVWDIRSGRALARPMRHERGVDSLEFTPDGRLLVTRDTAGTLRLWHLGFGLPIAPPMPQRPGCAPAAYLAASGSLIIPGPATEHRIIILDAIP